MYTTIQHVNSLEQVHDHPERYPSSGPESNPTPRISNKGAGHGDARSSQYAGGAEPCRDHTHHRRQHDLPHSVTGQPQRQGQAALVTGVCSLSHDMVSGWPTPRPSPMTARTTTKAQPGSGIATTTSAAAAATGCSS